MTISFTYVGARTIPVIEGDGQTVTKEKNGASFRIQSEHENFTGKVKVDGKRLERGTDFTDRSGSTIVELTESCLRALAPGAHTLTATFTDGVATAKFILMLGDVNGDGVLDGRDAIRLMKYLAGETDPETGTPTEINMTAADMNDDGVVDELDLIRLTKKLAEG